MYSGLPQAIYSIISPGWFVTPVYGNDLYLFTSAYFYLSILLVVVLALLPRYIAKAYQFSFSPSDMDRARWIAKLDPTHDFKKDKHGGLAKVKRPATRKASLRRSAMFNGSRTDMATGLREVNRGFDFAAEENGVAIQRMQSHLSGRLTQTPEPRKSRRHHTSLMHGFSISRTLRRKKRTLGAEHVEQIVEESSSREKPPPLSSPNTSNRS